MPKNKTMEENITDLIEIVVEIKDKMATKDDIAELKSEMKGEFKAVRNEFSSELESVRIEIAEELAITSAPLKRIEKRTLEDDNALSSRTTTLEKRVGALERNVKHLQRSR